MAALVSLMPSFTATIFLATDFGCQPRCSIYLISASHQEVVLGCCDAQNDAQIHGSLFDISQLVAGKVIFLVLVLVGWR